MDFLHRTWAEIDINALVHNFEIIKKNVGDAAIMAVVKADAYGHSVKDIAPVLQNGGADYFAVSNIEEAITLRKCGIVKPILILGYTPVSMAHELCVNDIIQCVYSPEYAAALSESAAAHNEKIKIHIKLDTGMSRLGFDCRSEDLNGIDDAIIAASLKGFCFEGVFTHFAVSDRTKATDDGFTDEQYKRFMSAIDKFKAVGLVPKLCHCANSAAVCIDKDKQLDICRPGIILYGLSPAEGVENTEALKPVMTVKSVVSMVKTVKAGETVSYGRTFKAESDIKLATVTAGYADGYPRRLSNKGYVLIKGKRANIIGRVCMDQMCVDVTDIEDVSFGDEVVLFGKELPVDELAELSGTINYEIICGISPRVPRIIIK